MERTVDHPQHKKSKFRLIGIAALTLIAAGIVAAIAIPKVMTMQLKAKRAEMPGSLDEIMAAEMAYSSAFDTYLPCGSEAEARSGLKKKPRGAEAGECWEKLGWNPDSDLRAAYWVEVSGESVTVHGISDFDGDGEVVHNERTNQQSVFDCRAPPLPDSTDIY